MRPLRNELVSVIESVKDLKIEDFSPNPDDDPRDMLRLTVCPLKNEATKLMDPVSDR